MNNLGTTYYKVMFERKNMLKEKFLLFFLALAPIFRIIPEVFLRRCMGRRYFNFTMAMFLAILLAAVPFIYVSISHYAPNWYDPIIENIFYYVFLSAYVYQCFMRRKDIKHITSVFDFEEYTKSAGYIHSKLADFAEEDGDINYRLVDTVIEPLIILVFGMLCLLFSKGLGLLLIFSALVYRLSYVAQYYLGDSVIMDAIDETLAGQELERIMINGHSKDGNKGVRYYGMRPSKPDLRQPLWDAVNRRKKKDDDEDKDGGKSLAV